MFRPDEEGGEGDYWPEKQGKGDEDEDDEGPRKQPAENFFANQANDDFQGQDGEDEVHSYENTTPPRK